MNRSVTRRAFTLIVKIGVSVRRAKVSIFSGCNSHPATVVPAGSHRSCRGGNDTAEASDGKGRVGGPASRQAVTRVNAEQASKHLMRQPTQQRDGEGRRREEHRGNDFSPSRVATGVMATACLQTEGARNTGNPSDGSA